MFIGEEGGMKRRRCLPLAFGGCRSKSGGAGVTKQEGGMDQGTVVGKEHGWGLVALLTEMAMLYSDLGDEAATRSGWILAVSQLQGSRVRKTRL